MMKRTMIAGCMSVFMLVCLMASCTVIDKDPGAALLPSETEPCSDGTDTAESVSAETTSEEAASASPDTSDGVEKTHPFTLVMNETVYATNFQSITFRVRSSEPGVTLCLEPKYFVYRVEEDSEILVGHCGEEVLLEATPVDENDYACIDLSFTPKSLIMEDEFTAGTYRIYHKDDREVYAEFELKDE